MKSSKEEKTFILVTVAIVLDNNNMAHVLEQNQFFLFRTKDIHSKGLVGNFDFPEEEAFDIDVYPVIPGKSRSIPAHTDGLWIGRLRLIMSLMAVLTPMGLHFD